MTIPFVLAILVEKRLSKCRELIIVAHDSKALGRMLPYERVNDAKRLTRSRCTKHNRTTEGIDDIDPALVHPFVQIVHHRDIHGIFVGVQFLRLLKGFVLKVKPVLAQLVVVVTGDAVTSLMNQHCAYYARQGI